MEALTQLIDIFLHLDKHLKPILAELRGLDLPAPVR